MSRSEKHRITVIGSSFVKRLQNDIKVKSQCFFKKNFGLGDCCISFVFRGGLKTINLHLLFNEVKATNPDFLIFHVGANDLSDSDTKGEMIADNLIALAAQLKSLCNAKSVVLCRGLNREKGRYLVTRADVNNFNIKLQKFNQFLQIVGPTNKNFIFWKHPGFTAPSLTVLGADGVHLNPRGQYKFYKSLRGAILACLASVSRDRVHS